MGRWVGGALDILEPALRHAVERGVEFSIDIRKPSDREVGKKAQEAVDLLVGMGCVARLAESRHSCIAVMDGETVWYGSLPLLAFAKKDECSLRFKSCEVAYDLAESEGLASA